MGKASYLDNHDWLALRATFKDGTKANVTWSRNAGPGGNVLISPPDPRQAEGLSLIVAEAGRLAKAGHAYANLRDMCAIMKAVAEKADTIDAYIEGLKPALGVTGERPKPKGADNAPAATVANQVKSRGGWKIDAFFPTGERINLVLNRASIGFTMDPNVPSKFTEVTNFLFGVKNLGVMDNDALAESVTEAAREAGSVDEWLAGMRAAFMPAPRR